MMTGRSSNAIFESSCNLITPVNSPSFREIIEKPQFQNSFPSCDPKTLKKKSSITDKIILLEVNVAVAIKVSYLRLTTLQREVKLVAKLFEIVELQEN